MADAAAGAARRHVIATGQSRSVREFVDVATARLGIRLAWEGQGAEQVGRVESCTLDAGAAAGARQGDRTRRSTLPAAK